MHFAAKNGHVEIIKLITDNAAGYNPRDFDGKTPLHVAAENGHVTICEMIMKVNEDIFPVMDDENCTTPFDLAGSNGHTDIKKLIKSFVKRKF